MASHHMRAGRKLAAAVLLLGLPVAVMTAANRPLRAAIDGAWASSSASRQAAVAASATALAAVWPDAASATAQVAPRGGGDDGSSSGGGQQATVATVAACGVGDGGGERVALARRAGAPLRLPATSAGPAPRSTA